MIKKDKAKNVIELTENLRDDIIEFTKEVIKTKSLTCQEENMAKLILKKFKELDFDEVKIDDMGNVIATNGNGENSYIFDSHMDTVGIVDENAWKKSPFGGEISDGKIYGRGASDMKSSLVASIYGAYIAKEVGLNENVSICVSASCMEEDYDGKAVEYILNDSQKEFKGAIICEPTDLQIATGHRGRALIEINVEGKSAHASNPDNGINPLYISKDIIDSVEKLSDKLNYKIAKKGSIALTNLYCNTPSNNSVPENVKLILDRRLSLGETEEKIKEEMDLLIKDRKRTSWMISDIKGRSWTGKDFIFHSFLPAWEISKDENLVLYATEAFRKITGNEPTLFQMQACTNGVTTAGKFNIPTIVFGPGKLEMAHANDEYCDIEKIIDATKIYAMMSLEFN